MKGTPGRPITFLLPFWLTAAIVGCVVCVQVPSTYAQTTLPVDIIVEGQTYTPYFYAGRAEPSAGNPIRLIALVESSPMPSMYQWRVGNQVVSTLQPVLQTTLPITEQRFLVSVTALDANNRTLAKGGEYVSVSQPRLLFYEDNALRGTSPNAVQETFILSGTEATIKAEPYFAGAVLPRSLRAHWSSNLMIEPSSDDWRLLYIRHGDDGQTGGSVRLQLTNPNNLNEHLTADFNVSL